jgi:hypothetical protein
VTRRGHCNPVCKEAPPAGPRVFEGLAFREGGGARLTPGGGLVVGRPAGARASVFASPGGLAILGSAPPGGLPACARAAGSDASPLGGPAAPHATPRGATGRTAGHAWLRGDGWRRLASPQGGLPAAPAEGGGRDGPARRQTTAMTALHAALGPDRRGRHRRSNSMTSRGLVRGRARPPGREVQGPVRCGRATRRWVAMATLTTAGAREVPAAGPWGWA